MMCREFRLAFLAFNLFVFTTEAADDSVFFEKNVRPVLATNCCKGAGIDAVAAAIDAAVLFRT